MSLYKEWTEGLESIETREDYNEFFKDYMGKEAECYKKILEAKNPVIEGKIKELAEENNLTPLEYIGFLDGANTCLLLHILSSFGMTLLALFPLIVAIVDSVK